MSSLINGYLPLEPECREGKVSSTCVCVSPEHCLTCVQGSPQSFKRSHGHTPYHVHLPSSDIAIPLEIFLMSAFFRNSSLAKLLVCCRGLSERQSKGDNFIHVPLPTPRPLSSLCPKLYTRHLYFPRLIFPRLRFDTTAQLRLSAQQVPHPHWARSCAWHPRELCQHHASPDAGCSHSRRAELRGHPAEKFPY